MLEDICNKNGQVVIGANSIFLDSLMSLSQELGFNLKVLPVTIENQTWWLRDVLLPIKNKIYTQNINGDYKQQRDEILSYITHSERGYYKYSNRQLHTAQTKTTDFETVGEAKVSKLDRVVLEGGNVFSAVNKEGKNFIIIGENAVLDTCAYLLKSNPDLSEINLPKSNFYINNKFDEKFIKLRAYAKELIANSLGINKEDIIILPQWTYHLDLQMSYLGKSQFIINTFEVPSDIDYEDGLQDYFGYDPGLRAPKDVGLAEKIKDTFDKLNEQYGKSIIEVIQNKLIKRGFEVSLVLGSTFYNNRKQDSSLNQVDSPYCRDSRDLGATALLMNGITVFSPILNKRVFITANAVTQESGVYETFKKQLEKLDVELRLVDINKDHGLKITINSDKSKTLDFVRSYEGSVRCQTVILNSGTSCHSEPPLLIHNKMLAPNSGPCQDVKVGYL